MAFQVEASLLMWGFVLKGLAFWFEVARITSVQRKIGLKSIFWEMGNFWSMCLEASIKVIAEYHNFGIFCSLKRFGRFKIVASLDAYQITNYQFLQKFIIFCCLIFEEFERSFWIRNFKANCLSRRDQRVYSIFQNRAPRGTEVFNGFQSGRKYLSRWIYYQQ